jgi:hypothetical protein
MSFMNERPRLGDGARLSLLSKNRCKLQSGLDQLERVSSMARSDFGTSLWIKVYECCTYGTERVSFVKNEWFECCTHVISSSGRGGSMMRKPILGKKAHHVCVK